MTLATKKKSKRLPKGLSLHCSGQYRADIDGRTLYLGTDAKAAEKRFQLYKATRLHWSRSYRQFVKEIAGTVRAFGNTPEEAQANYERFVADNWQNGPQPEPAPVVANTSLAAGTLEVKSIADVANAYVSWCYENRSDKHALDATDVFRRLAAFVGQDTLVVCLNPSDLSAYRQHCMKTTKTRFNKHMRIIKAALRRCRREQWLCVSKGWLEDLLDPLEVTTIVPQETPVFSPAELRLVLEHASSQLRVIVLVALNCALGNKDIADLQWRDIEFAAGLLNYRRAKTHRKRRTPLWAETLAVLQTWKNLRRPKELQNLVFTTRNGNPWVRTIVKGDKRTPDDGIGKELNKLLHSLGMKRPRLSFYSIRHTATTWATEFAANDQLVKEGNEFLLGHAPDAMWKRYSHAIPPSLKQAVAAIRRGWLSAYPEGRAELAMG